MKTFFVVLVISVIWAPSAAIAQTFAPPPAQAPNEIILKSLETKTSMLDRALAALGRQGVSDPWLAEVQIYHKASSWILRHNEFFAPQAGQWTQEILDRGLLRVTQLAGGETPWLHQFGHSVVRAYRSRVDGSVQPYAVTWPADYGKDPRKKWRLDVVLHGRDAALTEVKFLHQHAGNQADPKQNFVRIDIFGRGNNAYRWAGETDVFEAIDAFLAVERFLGRDGLLDPARVVLRGFSMGGAGTWQLGLHHPDRWCVLGPGAGFTATHGYLKGIPDHLPDYQESCLRIYDAVAYAENVFNVPVVAYAGANDPQLQAARNIEDRLKPLHIGMKLLIAPGLEHKFPPEWQQRAEQAYAPYAGDGAGRNLVPERIRWTTYTLRYPSCAWVEILAMNRHYDQALVDARRNVNEFTVSTRNVRVLRLSVPDQAGPAVTLTIDNQELKTRPHLGSPGAVPTLYLERKDNRWRAVMPQKLAADRARRLQKVTGLQGPIDDAFMESFLCVRGTGKPWHDAVQKHADGALDRFQQEWDKFMRAKLPVKDDVDVTDDDIASRHLILFGDPASNSLIGDALDHLPLQWTDKSLTLADGRSFSSTEHLPILIYPSPFNTGRYLVLNSGHTFRAADFRGTNALLYPRLGDYAVLKLAPTAKDPMGADVAAAGLFDDDWQLKNRNP
jgi:dienelactone hydrolase